jgi:AcrR family transcriptional regulator
MKSSARPHATRRAAPKRPYRMSARAEAAAATGERIITAAMRLFEAYLYDEVSLADVAAAAGVTIKTVLRRFGSKDGLIAAAQKVGLEVVRRERTQAPVGDVPGAIRDLVRHYELRGDAVMRWLAQEERVPALRRVTDAGRALHYAWVDQVFAPWLGKASKARSAAVRQERRARLIAVTDVYVWKIFRRDLGLDVAAVEASIRQLVETALT